MKGYIFFLVILFLVQMVVCTDSHLQKLEKTVEKLQDIVLSVTRENITCKKTVKDLTEKVLNQDRRIENLEKVCKSKYDFYTGANTKKTRGAQKSVNNHPIVEGIDAKKTMPKGRILEMPLSKRAINSGHGETNLSILLVSKMNGINIFFFIFPCTLNKMHSIFMRNKIGI